ncbi:MAG: hypothetical protein IJ240_04505 [Clostridia bacterium]|nr:hypothetical protein [Clostridia bacterium]
MKIQIIVKNMKEAERLSNICKDYPYDMALYGKDEFAIDPKSELGILALMVPNQKIMTLDTLEMKDTVLPGFLERLDRFLYVDAQAAS